MVIIIKGTDRIIFSGKAWEIRAKLRDWKKNAAKDTKWVHFTHCLQQRHSMPSVPQQLRKEKSTDLQQSLFPSS